MLQQFYTLHSCEQQPEWACDGTSYRYYVDYASCPGAAPQPVYVAPSAFPSWNVNARKSHCSADYICCDCLCPVRESQTAAVKKWKHGQRRGQQRQAQPSF